MAVSTILRTTLSSLPSPPAENAVQDVDDVFKKYDPKGTGLLDVHKFVLKIISPEAQPEPWFRDRATYEFHVLNRAPMKKVQRGVTRLEAECTTARLEGRLVYHALISAIMCVYVGGGTRISKLFLPWCLLTMN